MMLKIFTTTLFACGAITTAWAADVVTPQETDTTTTTFSWSSIYLGAQAGGGWGKSKNTSNMSSDTLKPNGFLGGIYAGYNQDAGDNIILGFEADAAYATLKKTSDISLLKETSKLSWTGAARARAGYAIDQFLPYIAGGFAYGRVEYNATDIKTGLLFSQGKDNFSGWTVGGGAEYAVMDNALVRLEYRYTDFGNHSYTFNNNQYKVDFKTHDVRFGVAYKF